MWYRALSVLGCPRCFGPLRAETATAVIEEGNLWCDRDHLEFRIRAGIPDLVLPERVAWADAFAESYSRAWGSRGPGAFRSSQVSALPFVPLTSRRGWSWRLKARSLEALLGFLDARSVHRVLDLGCGAGWLSYRLAQRGFETYGLDILREGPIGLEASRAYRQQGAPFDSVRGEIERPPFQDGGFDLVVGNASIHFGQSLPDVLTQCRRLLVPGGVFVMMNSPVHEDPDSASRAQVDAQRELIRRGASPDVAARYHHFARREINGAFEGAFGSTNELRWDPGWSFRAIRRAKSVLLRMEVAKFPFLWTIKPHS